ncbi:MAG: hypothetical protein WBG42_13575 [Cryomorphaceae bacterium]
MISASIGLSRLFTLSAAILGFSAIGFCQTDLNAGNFETAMLTYKPIKKADLPDKNFNYGSMIISEMQSDVSNDEKGYNRADYFNVLSAFLTLQESEENIKLAFEKFSQAEGACEYFTSFEDKVRQSDKYNLIRDEWLERADACKKSDKPKVTFNPSEYSRKHKLNLEVVKLIAEIENRDQLYRGGDLVDKSGQQQKADLQNQILIDSLFNQYDTYLGESFVGPKFSSVMWLVIQHSNPEMMKKYLPVLKEAVAEKELALAPLKMTIDRYYALEYGYQIFGSQGGDLGVKLADEDTRERVMKQYGIH